MKVDGNGSVMIFLNQRRVTVSLEVPPLKLKEGRYIDFLVKRVIRWIVAITMPITAVAALG